MITDFCGRFESDFPLAFRWSGLKPIGYSVVESFDEGVGFSWRAYRNLGTGYTCADSAMGSFVDTVGTTTPLGLLLPCQSGEKVVWIGSKHP